MLLDPPFSNYSYLLSLPTHPPFFPILDFEDYLGLNNISISYLLIRDFM